jgi:uncharacterized protein (DUF4415 family)
MEPDEPLSDEVKANLEELKNMPDSEIDTSDIPEWTDEMWKRAVRGADAMKMWRPVKQAVSLRLDADVLAWLKKDGQGVSDAGEPDSAGADDEGFGRLGFWGNGYHVPRFPGRLAAGPGPSAER